MRRASASTAAETETVSWLVRHHLLLSSTAFKRDLADPKTIEDFVHQVQSPERLRLLLILTVVDIRAVGPGVWNEWKRTLLRTLFEAAEERLRLGHKQHGRAELVQHRQQELAEALGWKASAARAHARRLPDSYWLAEPLALAGRQRAAGRRRPKRGSATPSRASSSRTMPESGATRVSVFTPDREGLFYRICAGLASAGANIIDARIHTTRDGMALDNLLVLDGRGQPYSRPAAAQPAGTLGRGGADQRTSRRHCRARAGAPRAAAPSKSRPRSPSPSARRPGPRWSRSMPATARRCSPRLAAAIHDCGHTSIRRISRPTASARSTSST